MLTPEQVKNITRRIEDLAEDFHLRVIRRIAGRILEHFRSGDDYLLTATDKHQIKVLQEAGMLADDIAKDLANVSKVGPDIIKKEFGDAIRQSDDDDMKVYTAADISPKSLKEDAALIRIAERDAKATADTFLNLTRTTADACQRAFIEACDEAYNMANSGLLPINQAVMESVERLARKGVQFVSYTHDDGTVHRDTIETATLRAVRTGITQCAAEITLERMKQYNWDIVLVSAHLGARDKGEGPENHAKWQGKFYSLSGKDYPNFYEVTGYGTGEGLSGWNCRHTFGPGNGKFNPYKDIDPEENHKVYELSQKQRLYEREIRKNKREFMVAEALANENPKDKTLVAKRDKLWQDLRRRNEAYLDFCEKNDLKPAEMRLKVGGF